MNVINLPTCFVYILLKVGVPPPQIKFKAQVLLVFIYNCFIFYYNYLSNVYNLYTISSSEKIIPKSSLTPSCKTIIKF